MQQPKEEEEDKVPVFKVTTSPAQLDQLDIVWSMALESQNIKVVPKAIDFLIKVYSQLDDDMNDEKISI